jgi:hypothetical protein
MEPCWRAPGEPARHHGHDPTPPAGVRGGRHHDAADGVAGETLDERLATLGRPLDLARELRAAVACAPVAALAAGD